MTGLDTVELLLPANEVRFHPLFAERLRDPQEKRADIKRGAVPEKEFGLCRDTSGAVVSGKSAFINAGDFGFELLPLGDAGMVRVKLSAGAFTGDNTEPMDGERLAAVVPLMGEGLEEWGVELDLSAARLSRVDTSRNIELAHTVAAYLEPFRAAAFRYGVVPTFEGAHSFRLNLNTARSWERQWGCYDKGLERDRKSATGPKKRAVGFSKLGRFELRQRGPALARVLETQRPTLGHLMQPGALDRLAAAHRASARDDLLSMLPETELALRCDETRLASLLAQLRQGSTPARFNADAARVASLLAAGGFAGAAEAWEDAFAPVLPGDSQKERERKKRARTRERRELRRVANFINAAGAAPSGAARRELVSELREKLLSE